MKVKLVHFNNSKVTGRQEVAESKQKELHQ